MGAVGHRGPVNSDGNFNFSREIALPQALRKGSRLVTAAGNRSAGGQLSGGKSHLVR